MQKTTVLGILALISVIGCGDDGTAPGSDGGGIDGATGDVTLVDCTGMADGTECGDNQICLAEACLNTRCGDGYVNTAAEEVCDDGNETSGDGCEPGSCLFSCTEASECDDGDPCNGEETCNGAANRCQAGSPPTVETACTREGGEAGVCSGGFCASPDCGDMVVNTGEDCDDGQNGDPLDGCKDDCTFTCTEEDASFCSDGNACNGDEACVANACNEPAEVDCDDADACTADSCDPDAGCENSLIDVDGDGFATPETCSTPGLRGGDCDDMNNTVYPGAAEFCDAIDHDCNGEPMNDVTDIMCLRDFDRDGYGNPRSVMSACSCPAGYVPPRPENDCMDGSASAFPGQESYFTGPHCFGRGCAGTLPYDYDCDGVQEREHTDLIDCADRGFPFARCSGDGWTGGSVPNCGVRAGYNTCSVLGGVCRPSLFIVGPGIDPPSRVQSCR